MQSQMEMVCKQMTDTAPLSAELSRRVLKHLGLPDAPEPDLAALQQLVASYTRTVPWESASRIARRARHPESAQCVIYGETFWESHFAAGTGGTCYESNYAFFGLLRQLGYAGYLTINDIGGAAGCHSAIVVLLDGCKYLVDVGFPLYTVVKIESQRETKAACPIMNYSLAPKGGDQYQLRRELRERAHSFVLHDRPVGDAEYRAIGIHDYRHDGGQFLDAIVIHRVVAEQLWRFHSDVRPYCLQQFVDGERRDHLLDGDMAGEVAQKFGISRDILVQAAAALDLAEQ